MTTMTRDSKVVTIRNVHSESRSKLFTTLVLGAIVRILLATLTSLPAVLQNRIELTTPITSYTRLLEGLHLATLQDPYAGGSFHHPPLMLLLRPLQLQNQPEWRIHLIWTITELLTAWCLATIAESRTRGVLLSDEGESVWPAWKVVAIFLFHPFSILTSLSKSSIVFSNLFIAASLSSAVDGSLLLTAFSLSIATHLSLYPVLLIPPIILMLRERRKEQGEMTILTVIGFISAFAAHQSILMSLGHWMTGSWEFLSSVYGVILTIPDLTPTIGLGWYFFIEMFDYFRAFFVGVFQLHVLIYVAPLTIAYAHDPLFAAVSIVGVFSIFKSYPSLGDFALWHALLACYSELNNYLPRPVFLICLTLYSLALLPTFHHLWLYSGTGNSNFFYASTLVWALSQGGLWVDMLAANGKRRILMGLGRKSREKVKAGQIAVVQK